MFTGIIEEIGCVIKITNNHQSSRITINADRVLEQTKIGDSISTNGVCLTVAQLNITSFEADIMNETLKRSNLGLLSVGDKVNLERALSLETRLGGHIVSGHIDGTGNIESKIREDNAIKIKIRANEKILKYIVEKGSIAIDGISLTVISVDREIFEVGIIPHTGEETILLSKNINETVNLECDVIGKYVEKLMGLSNESINKKANVISEEFLESNGFF